MYHNMHDSLRYVKNPPPDSGGGFFYAMTFISPLRDCEVFVSTELIVSLANKSESNISTLTKCVAL